MDSSSAFLVSGASFLSYLFFKRFEPRTLLPLLILLGLFPAALSLLLRFQPTGRSWSSVTTSLIYYTSLIGYTVAYRLSPLHPLAKYPGPFPNKVSKFWMAWVTSAGKQHIYYRQLHDKFGDIVRIGPNELSIRHVDAIHPVLGSPGLPKGPFWDDRQGPQQGGVPSLISTRDPAEHLKRRKPWNRAFSTASLKNYEDIIAGATRDLVCAFEKRTGQPLDISQWMTYFALDFMGEMAFGHRFGLVHEGKDEEHIQHLVDDGMKFTAVVAHFPWATGTLTKLPGRGASQRRLKQFGAAHVHQRIAAGSKYKDLFYHLIDEEGLEPEKPSRPTVTSDGVLAVIAGSDTTATSLAVLWHYLMLNPTAYKRLQEEIDGYFPPDEEPLDYAKMARMPFLNACINEALRLLPPLLSGAQRSVLPGTGGKQVGPFFIPESTQVFVHTYSLLRDARYFSPLPDTFWPDRWLPESDRKYPPGVSASDVILNTAAFIPFSFGPAVCAGKNLALMELRSVVCFVLQHFEISVPAEFRGEVEQWEEQIKDYFIGKISPMHVLLTRRAAVRKD